MGVGSHHFSPGEQLVGIDFVDELVIGRHMFTQSGVSTGLETARMESHIFAFVNDLHQVLRDPQIHFLMNQGMRRRVEMFIEFHVIIDIHPGYLADGKFI